MGTTQNVCKPIFRVVTFMYKYIFYIDRAKEEFLLMIKLIRTSLMYKMIVFFAAIISSIMIMMGGFSYVKGSQAIKSDAEKFSSQILKQADLNISRYYKEYT